MVSSQQVSTLILREAEKKLRARVQLCKPFFCIEIIFFRPTKPGNFGVNAGGKSRPTSALRDGGFKINNRLVHFDPILENLTTKPIGRSLRDEIYIGTGMNDDADARNQFLKLSSLDDVANRKDNQSGFEVPGSVYSHGNHFPRNPKFNFSKKDNHYSTYSEFNSDSQPGYNYNAFGKNDLHLQYLANNFLEAKPPLPQKPKTEDAMVIALNLEDPNCNTSADNDPTLVYLDDH
jgi:hypothetical protein